MKTTRRGWFKAALGLGVAAKVMPARATDGIRLLSVSRRDFKANPEWTAMSGYRWVPAFAMTLLNGGPECVSLSWDNETQRWMKLIPV